MPPGESNASVFNLTNHFVVIMIYVRRVHSNVFFFQNNTDDKTVVSICQLLVSNSKTFANSYGSTTIFQLVWSSNSGNVLLILSIKMLAHT